MIRLPEDLELELHEEMIAYEEKIHMPYVMSWERFAEERGKKLGLELGEKRGEAKSLLTLFRAKFGVPEPEVEARVYAAPSR